MKRPPKFDVPLTPKPRQLLVIAWGTRIVSLAISLSILLSAMAMLFTLPNMFVNGITLPSCQYFTFVMFNVVLSAAIAWHFNRFIWEISERSEIFTRAQSERLISLAFLHLCMFVLRLVAPILEAPKSSVSWFQPVEVHPEADLHLLMFAAMFFALAGVFEYGRMLKKDSDSIV